MKIRHAITIGLSLLVFAVAFVGDAPASALRGPEQTSNGGCTGFAPMSAELLRDGVTVEHKEEQTRGGCRVALAVRDLVSSALSGAACTTTATPRAVPGGVDIEVWQQGSCNGVEVRTSVDIAPGQAPTRIPVSPGETTTRHPGYAGHEWIDSRILGHDIWNFHITMFLAYQQIDWDYAEGYPYNGSFPYWQWVDDFWNVEFQTNGAWYQYDGYGASHYYAYNYVHFDTWGSEAWVQPAARGYGDGGWSCSFWQVWENPLSGFHFHNLCRLAY